MNKIGIDIVQIDRIKLDENFLKKILHEKEFLLLEKKPSIETKMQFVAGRWAAKEAMFKAIGKIQYPKINISYNEEGKPIVIGFENKIEISISHEKDYAVAIAISL